MEVSYQIEIYEPTGTERLGYLSAFLGASWTRKVSDVGAGTLRIMAQDLPAGVLNVDGQIRRDLRILPYRSEQTTPPRLLMDTLWLTRGLEFTETRAGDIATIRMADAIDLVRRRIVASDAGTAGARKTGAAEIIMKAFANEAFGPGAIAARQFPNVAIQPNLAIGPTLTKACSRRNLLQTLQEIAADAAQAGTYMAFDIIAISPSQLEFQVYTGQRGTDQRANLLVGSDFGNLTDVVTDFAADDEVTQAYAGGQGEGTERAVTAYGDTERIAASPYNRIEVFVDSRNIDATTTADLTNEARAAVRGGRPRQTGAGSLVPTPATRFERDYHFGDYVRAQTGRGSFDARIEAVQVTIERGVETVDAKLWSDSNA